MSDRYAEPQSPFAANDADLAKLREQLADAEKVAGARTSTWTMRTRAEQDAKQLRRQLEAAELDAVRKARHASRQTPDTDANLVAAHLATATNDEGTFAAPVSPWATNVQKPDDAAFAPPPKPETSGGYDAAREYLKASFRSAGKPIPKWLETK